jgi:anti-sigma B factor antagonist
VDLRVVVEEAGGWSIVRVHGDVDVASAPVLREHLVRAVADGHVHVILDLDDVHFIDSTGIGVVIGLLKRTRSLGGDLRLVSTREMLARVFEITRLDRALPIEASVEAALAAAGPPGS